MRTRVASIPPVLASMYVLDLKEWCTCGTWDQSSAQLACLMMLQLLTCKPVMCVCARARLCVCVCVCVYGLRCVCVGWVRLGLVARQAEENRKDGWTVQTYLPGSYMPCDGPVNKPEPAPARLRLQAAFPNPIWAQVP